MRWARSMSMAPSVPGGPPTRGFDSLAYFSGRRASCRIGGRARAAHQWGFRSSRVPQTHPFAAQPVSQRPAVGAAWWDRFMTQTAVIPTRFRLRGGTVAPGVAEPTAEQLRVISHGGRRLRVLAGPGTGKSFTLVEAVAERIRRGVPAEQILVLTFSRRAAAELTARITTRLGITTREPLVRTLHGYAFSLLRAQAVRAGEPAPRLLAAGESDQMVRELLDGQRDSGRGGWPAT